MGVLLLVVRFWSAACDLIAGDLVSASPFESSVFKDEPTIEVLNAMGLDVSSREAVRDALEHIQEQQS